MTGFRALQTAHAWLPSAVVGRLLFREFADGTVCFDPWTGDTRLVSLLGGHLLQTALQKGRVAVDNVLDDLREHEDGDAEREVLRQHLDEVASQLIAAGWLVADDAGL